MVGIYKITNKVNNKSYIGLSVNIKRRWKEHRTRAYSENSDLYECPLYRAIRKYGLENFDFSILMECSLTELNVYEQYYINFYKTLDRNFGYNLIDNDYYKTGTLKITQELLIEIINLLKNSDLKQVEIAKKFNVAESTISQINQGKLLYQDNISYPIRKSHKKKFYCKNCGKEIDRHSTLCVACNGLKHRTVKNRPNREELKLLIRTLPFTKIGQNYGVTDNTVRKWCVAENLPKTKKEINQYTEEEWEKI